MGKLAKPLIIVVLVLCIVSLGLGIKLFSQREALKGRTQKLETAAVDVADRLHQEIDEVALKDYAKMDAPLKLLGAHAENTYGEMEDAKQDLDIKKTELAETELALDTAKLELEASEANVTSLQTDLETKEVELAQTTTRIDQLQQDKNGLQVQVDDINTKLVDAEEETRDLQDQIATLEQAYQNLVVEVGDQRPVVPVGLTGEIVMVNPYWNFVVLDIGGDAGLSPHAEMLVHREDRLIGKVRISSVEDEMAIAEIMTDWEQIPLREGDHVLF